MENPTSLRILSWNLHDGGRAMAENWITRHLSSPSYHPDFVIFQEYNTLHDPSNFRPELHSAMGAARYTRTCVQETTPRSTQRFSRQVAVYRNEQSSWTWTDVATPQFIGYARGLLYHVAVEPPVCLVPCLHHADHKQPTIAAMLKFISSTGTGGARHIAVGDFNLEYANWVDRTPLLTNYHSWLPALAPRPTTPYPGTIPTPPTGTTPTYYNNGCWERIDYALVEPARRINLVELIHHCIAQEVSDHFPIEMHFLVT